MSHLLLSSVTANAVNRSMYYGSALKQDCEVVPCLSRLGDAPLQRTWFSRRSLCGTRCSELEGSSIHGTGASSATSSRASWRSFGRVRLAADRDLDTNESVTLRDQIRD